MDQSWLVEARKCFEPAPPPEKWAEIEQELISIAECYDHDSRQPTLFLRPIRRAGEEDDAYVERINAMSGRPRRRGRPQRLAQNLLVFSLRKLLLNCGCHYGAPKPEDRRSRLAELAEIIHKGIQAPGSRIGWRSIAERMADPVYQLELIFPGGVKIEGSRTATKNLLAKAEVRPRKKRF